MIREKSKNTANTRQIQVLIAALALVVVAVLAVIFLQANQGTGTVGDYADVPQSRTEDGAFVLGNPEAAVTVVLFEDFLCPHCQDYQPEVKRFVSEYVLTGKAQLEFRMIVAVDPTYSRLAFSLAECSEQLKPNSFWNAHDELFRSAAARRFSEQSARDFAETMGLTYTDLLTCTEGVNQWATDGALGQTVGVRGTPTVGIRLNGGDIQIVPGQPTAEDLGALVNLQG